MARRKFKRSGTTHRRRASTKTRSRRRRIGATALNFSASSPLVKWGSVVVGFMKPDLLPISKMVGDKIDGKIVAGAEVGLGFLLAMKKGKKKGMLQTVLGGYLIGAGIKNGMAAFGIGGIGPYGRVNVVNGYGPYGRVNVINGGYSPNRSIRGYSPNGTINKVMTGVNTGNYNSNASGSGVMTSNPGSNLMN